MRSHLVFLLGGVILGYWLFGSRKEPLSQEKIPSEKPTGHLKVVPPLRLVPPVDEIEK
jgi:hypothetical protein